MSAHPGFFALCTAVSAECWGRDVRCVNLVSGGGQMSSRYNLYELSCDSAIISMKKV